MGETEISLKYETLENNSEHIKIREYMNQCITDFVIKREQLLTQMFSKNLSTEELLSIIAWAEKELLERGLDKLQIKNLSETKKQELHCKLEL